MGEADRPGDEGAVGIEPVPLLPEEDGDVLEDLGSVGLSRDHHEDIPLDLGLMASPESDEFGIGIHGERLDEAVVVGVF